MANRVITNLSSKKYELLTSEMVHHFDELGRYAYSKIQIRIPVALSMIYQDDIEYLDIDSVLEHSGSLYLVKSIEYEGRPDLTIIKLTISNTEYQK